MATDQFHVSINEFKAKSLLASKRKFDDPVAEAPAYGTAEQVEAPPGFWAQRAIACLWFKMQR
ncbi:hypothetical protein N7475_008316 [Penicillium sp. IBT 31633x]|nr:hypothetical protein N7475_008316 [Penicillium sp. IBT 31633x]